MYCITVLIEIIMIMAMQLEDKEVQYQEYQSQI